MKRKKKPPENPHLERWLVSYADFITLMFAFFVVMYSVSMVDAKKIKEVMDAIRFATHFAGTGGVERPPVLDGPSPRTPFTPVTKGKAGEGAPTLTRPAILPEIVEVKAELEAKLAENLGEGPGDAKISEIMEVTITEEGIRIRLLAGFFFDAGSVVLRPEAIPVIDSIAAVLKKVVYQVRVEGHSDSQAGRDGDLNWRLSSDRALAIVHYLINGSRIDPSRLSTAAFAQYRPVTTNSTPEGRATNRRIDMFIICNTKAPSTK